MLGNEQSTVGCKTFCSFLVPPSCFSFTMVNKHFFFLLAHNLLYIPLLSLCCFSMSLWFKESIFLSLFQHVSPSAVCGWLRTKRRAGERWVCDATRLTAERFQHDSFFFVLPLIPNMTSYYEVSVLWIIKQTLPIRHANVGKSAPGVQVPPSWHLLEFRFKTALDKTRGSRVDVSVVFCTKYGAETSDNILKTQ